MSKGIPYGLWQSPIWRIVEPMQHLTGFAHEQHAFILAIGVILNIDGCGITVTEVDLNETILCV